MTGATAAGPALAGWLVGSLLAFGLRTWAHWRVTGTTGHRGITGRPGSPAWWGGVLFPVALLLGTLSPLVALTGTVTPPAALVRPIAAVQLQVRVAEEPYLRRVHGAAYRRYLVDTGRFLPRLRRARSSA